MWHQHGLFHARRDDHVGESQTCPGVDLFEVIAGLAQLDLEDEPRTRSALASEMRD